MKFYSSLTFKYWKHNLYRSLYLINTFQLSSSAALSRGNIHYLLRWELIRNSSRKYPHSHWKLPHSRRYFATVLHETSWKCGRSLIHKAARFRKLQLQAVASRMRRCVSPLNFSSRVGDRVLEQPRLIASFHNGSSQCIDRLDWLRWLSERSPILFD